MPLFNPGLLVSGGTITGSLQVDEDLACTNNLSCGNTFTSVGTASLQDGVSVTGDTTIATGNMVVSTAGNGLRIKEGANAKMGIATLNGITEVTVATTAIAATSRVFLSIEAPAGVIGGLVYVSSRIAGTSFGIKGIVAGDTSTVAWMIVDPA